MIVRSFLRRHVLPTLVASAAAAFVALPAAADAQSLLGAWVLSPERSSFVEAVTGPAPQAGAWTVSRDDGDRLVYTLVETRDGEVVARGSYDVSLHGGPSQSRVDGDVRNVVAIRAGDGSTVIEAPAVAQWRASIRIRRVSAKEAVIEHVLSGPSGDMVVERLVMERAAPNLLTANTEDTALK